MGPTQLLQIRAILGEAADLIEDLHSKMANGYKGPRISDRKDDILARLTAASDLLDEEALAQ